VLATLAEPGGVVTYIRGLLPAVSGFDVTVAAHGPGPLRAAVEEAGYRYVELQHVRRPLSPLRDVAGLVELVRLCRRVRPHIVHANSSKAGILGRLAAALCRVPIRIFSVHGWHFVSHSPRFLFLWADRLVSPLTTSTVCVAEYAREVGVGARTCRSDRTVVIPNGVLLGPRDDRGASRGGEVPLILSVGRLSAQKDYATLIEALRRVSVPFRLEIVGDGPDRAEIERRVEEAGLSGSVAVLGQRSDVPDLLRAADVFVLASHYEVMPMSILEAMAASLPVVASAVGGVPELVVEGETGHVVPPSDAEALARALTTVLADRGTRERLGAAGRERVEALFGLDRMQHRHVELYAELLGQRGLPMPALAS
jgi:glycosyltransferase involved in cell wall biosynthesis